MPPDESITYVTQNIKINLFKSFTIIIFPHPVKSNQKSLVSGLTKKEGL